MLCIMLCTHLQVCIDTYTYTCVYIYIHVYVNLTRFNNKLIIKTLV